MNIWEDKIKYDGDNCLHEKYINGRRHRKSCFKDTYFWSTYFIYNIGENGDLFDTSLMSLLFLITLCIIFSDSMY